MTVDLKLRLCVTSKTKSFDVSVSINPDTTPSAYRPTISLGTAALISNDGDSIINNAIKSQFWEKGGMSHTKSQ